MLALGCCGLRPRAAQEAAAGHRPAPGPELDFLEYLGAWAEEDDEWLAIEEWREGQLGADEEEDAEESESEREDDDESE